MAGAGGGCDGACPCSRGHAWRSRHLLLGAGSSGRCSSRWEPQRVLPPAGKGLRSALTVWCPPPPKKSNVQHNATRCLCGCFHARGFSTSACPTGKVLLWPHVGSVPMGGGRKALPGHPPRLPSLFPMHRPWSSPWPCLASEGAGGSPWAPLPSPNPPLCRTPSPATMPRLCAAPWITSRRRRRRRRRQKRLRTAASLRSASPKVRDRAELGTPWRGGGGHGGVVANQCLQCHSSRARLAQPKLPILLPLWVGVPMPSRVLPQPPPGRG